MPVNGLIDIDERGSKSFSDHSIEKACKMTPLEIFGLVAGSITIFGFLSALTKKGRAIIKRVWHFFTRYRPKLPRQTLKLIPKKRNCYWSMVRMYKKPAMYVVCDWHITNISQGDVLICEVNIKRPRITGHIMVRHPGRDIYGQYHIPPGTTTAGTVDFWIQPPKKKEDEPFVGSLEFIDQFGNIHLARRVKFNPRPKKEEKEETPPIEAISEIKAPVEKKVVGVLQAELNRYKICGRKVGGLGSIETTYRDRSFKGVGASHGISESSEQQFVATDPENAVIESDNARILTDFFLTLENEQKDEFVNALRSRLSKDKPYSDIGYFILLVLFGVGHLSVALETAKRDLQGDATHGFSNLLMLLSGLLRFEHRSFSDEMLDDVERFLKSITEHTFRAEERLAAVRALKLEESMKETE